MTDELPTDTAATDTALTDAQPIKATLPKTAASWLQQAKFLTSSPTFKGCPPDMGLEVAFAGRSNAGKSSAINKITQQRQLARASKTPGRTQMINYFTMGREDQRLVDLPGYGYAQVPEKMKLIWQKELEKYLVARQSLVALVLVMDARRPLTEFDQQMLQWSNQAELQTHVILTKCDKFKRDPARKLLRETEQRMQALGLKCSVQLFSSLNGDGVSALQHKLTEFLEQDLQGDVSSSLTTD